MMLVERRIRELSKRYEGACLRKGEYKKARRFVWAACSKTGRRQPLDAGCVPTAIRVPCQRSKRYSVRNKRLCRSRRNGISDSLHSRSHLARQHFNKARAVHADCFSLVGNVLQGCKLAVLHRRFVGRNAVGVIKRGKIEPLAENEYSCDFVAAPARKRFVVASRARIRIGTGNTIEISRKDQRIGWIGERRSSAFRKRTPCSLLDRPFGLEKLVAERDQARNTELKLIAIFQVADNGDFFADKTAVLRKKRTSE